MTFRFATAKRLYPIKPPNIIEFPESLMAEPPTEVVRFAPLEPPAQHSTPTIRKPSVSPSLTDGGEASILAVQKPRVFDLELLAPPPAARDISFSELLPAKNVSLFEPLPTPKVVGRTYRPDDASVSVETKVERSDRGDSSYVKAKRKASRDKGLNGPVAVDVFQQLRFILQPPILPQNGRPAIFPNNLRPYPFQITGVHWLVEHEQALLADQMGLGKTIQAIIAMRVLFRRGTLQQTLVVCPASMTNVWEREIKLWAPELRPQRIQGAACLRRDMWKAPAEIYIVSYETLTRDIKDLPSDKFGLYILDEAQKIKNPNTQNHRAVKRLTPAYRWALTGTPIENSATDVAALFDVLKPGLFNRDERFRHAARNVRRTIRPYLLRRTIDDAQLQLPELTHQHHWLDLLPRQRSAYQMMEMEGDSDIRRQGKGATRIHILALITRLKQICNFDEVSGQSCKLDFLEDQLEALTDGANDKALVFSQYPNKTIKAIAPKLQKFKPLIFDGSLSNSKRDDVVANFQESDENDILLMSVRAGGVGLTLTRANHVYHFDHWWNPAVVDQASARVHRIGQTKPVFIHSLYASDTIEERIFKLLEKKRAVFEEVLGAGLDDGELQRLTDDDLFGLFGLDAPRNEGPVVQQSTRDAGVPTSQRAALQRSAARPPLSAQTELEEEVRALFGHLGVKLSSIRRLPNGLVEMTGYRPGPRKVGILVRCEPSRGRTGHSVVSDFADAISVDDVNSEKFLIAGGTFTRRAETLARNKRITLIDGPTLKANLI